MTWGMTYIHASCLESDNPTTYKSRVPHWQRLQVNPDLFSQYTHVISSARNS